MQPGPGHHSQCSPLRLMIIDAERLKPPLLPWERIGQAVNG